jgi:hypothetical protein
MTQNNDNEKFKKAFNDYIDNRKMFDFKIESDGGYLIPEHFEVHREGFIAYILRYFNLSYGWRDVNLQKELLKKMDELKARQ